MIYSYECPDHGAFDQIRPLSDWNLDWVACPTCEAKSPRLVELCAIQADSLWHFGAKTKGGEVNSRSQLERYEKENNIVTLSGQNDRDAIRKMAAEGKKDLDRKAKKDRREAFEKAISGQGIVNSFGEMKIDD